MFLDVAPPAEGPSLPASRPLYSRRLSFTALSRAKRSLLLGNG
jgi:hypothetical protein